MRLNAAKSKKKNARWHMKDSHLDKMWEASAPSVQNPATHVQGAPQHRTAQKLDSSENNQRQHASEISGSSMHSRTPKWRIHEDHKASCGIIIKKRNIVLGFLVIVVLTLKNNKTIAHTSQLAFPVVHSSAESQSDDKQAKDQSCWHMSAPEECHNPWQQKQPDPLQKFGGFLERAYWNR